MTYLLSDKHRIIKFGGSLFILFVLSCYSYAYGLTQYSLKDKVKQNSKNLNSFTYLKNIEEKNNLIYFEDKWGKIWIAKWPKSVLSPQFDVPVSFKGKLNSENILYDIKDIIVHRGYKIKLYISVLALSILCIYFVFIFEIDNKRIKRIAR